jgi:hypothetical protein
MHTYIQNIADQATEYASLKKNLVCVQLQMVIKPMLRKLK